MLLRNGAPNQRRLDEGASAANNSIVKDKYNLSFTIKPPADAPGFCKEICCLRSQNPAQETPK